MARAVKPVPEGHHTITPHLIVRDASDAIEFYKKALGAAELCRTQGPDGRIMHAALQVGDSRVFLCDECPEYGAFGPQPGDKRAPVTIHLYVEDADSAFDRAVKAGATVTMPLADMFWGSRYGQIVDPYGHHWSIASQIEEVSIEETQKRAAARFAHAQ
jgi:uncharacterized glyoxalase superfamily protein PhnB